MNATNTGSGQEKQSDKIVKNSSIYIPVKFPDLTFIIYLSLCTRILVITVSKK